MYNKRVIEGRRGDEVFPWWQAVLRWLESSLPIILGPNVVATQTPLGTKVTVKTDNPVTVPFEVSVSETTASVLLGMLDSKVPFIRQRERQPEWLSLDGLVPGQQGDLPLESRPQIDLRDAEPGADYRSAICLVVKVDDNGRPLDPADNPENLRIEHRSDFSGSAKRKAGEAGEPFQELAILYWRN
ncbi:MAG: hypothetical protein AAF226_11685, partial [Verrucomicrobiota bacterium]